MESSDIGSRRADCGSAVEVICFVAIFLPFLAELYTVPDRTFIRDDTVPCDSAEIQWAAAVLSTVDTLSHSPVDNGSGILRHRGVLAATVPSLPRTKTTDSHSRRENLPKRHSHGERAYGSVESARSESAT